MQSGKSFITAAVVAIIMLGTALAPAKAFAQDRKYHFTLGGGPTFPLGAVADTFKMGWGPAFGADVDITDRVGVQVEYAYRYFELEDEHEVGLLSAHHTTHQIDFNFLGELTPKDAGVRAYVVAGPGMYYRTVAITQYEGSGLVCDPYLYICGSYPIESIVGDRSQWDFGFDVGGGVGFRFEGVEFYIESRYHYVWGKDITPGPNANASSYSTNASYWPLTFGFRF